MVIDLCGVIRPILLITRMIIGPTQSYYHYLQKNKTKNKTNNHNNNIVKEQYPHVIFGYLKETNTSSIWYFLYIYIESPGTALLTYLTPCTLDNFLHGGWTWLNILRHIHQDVLYKKKNRTAHCQESKNSSVARAVKITW